VRIEQQRTKRWFLGVAVSFGLIAGYPSTGARADDAHYETIVRDALAEFDAGHYEEAAALFEQAHAESPSARTHRGLGLTYFEARRYALSVRHLRAALTDKRRALTAEQRQTAMQVLQKAEAFVARVALRLTPADVKLDVDGHPAEVDGNELLLDIGHHELIARAAGYAEDRRILDARAGAPSELRIELQPTAAVASAPLPTAAASPHGVSLQPSTTAASRTHGRGVGIGPWVVAGTGLAMLGGATVTWVLANDDYSSLQKQCPGGACSGTKFESDRSAGKTLVVATDVLLVGGLIAVAAGATWWGLARGRADQPQVAFGCTTIGCSGSVRGAF
jgi:hypothetical protein